MNILAVGAHPDDIELGCGAALLAHRAAGHRVTMLVMSDGGRGLRDQRCRRDEQEEAADLLGATVRWGGFEDGSIPADREAVEVVEAAMRHCGADVVYVHAPNDSHQDHRATAAATASAARRSTRILRYEGPSTLNFAPTVFVDAERVVEGKMDLLRCHLSQVLNNNFVDLEALAAQMRHRGFQARLRWAEAFEPARFVWDPLSEAANLAIGRAGGEEHPLADNLRSSPTRITNTSHASQP